MRASFAFAASACGIILLAWGIAPALPVAALMLACTGGLLFIIALGLVAKELKRRSDPYSLTLLREIHEHGVAPEEEEPVGDVDSIYCPCCQTVYSIHLPICPNCKSGKSLGCG